MYGKPCVGASDMLTVTMYCICYIVQIDADTYWNEQHTSHAAKMVSGNLHVVNCALISDSYKQHVFGLYRLLAQLLN